MAILSISREYGGGAEEIGQAVAQRMNYDYVDKERILEDIKTAGERWQRLSEELDEVSPSIWDRYDWEYRGFISLIESYILDYAVKDRVVIMGRGSNFLLEDIPHALRVRIMAPLEDRVNRVMLHEHIDRKTAEWLIQKIDKERDRYTYANYGKSWSDASHYDMTFNTAIEPSRGVVDAIVDALAERESLATPEAREGLAQKVLVARVKARIATDSRFLIPTLEVSHDGAAIVLQGIIHSAGELHLVEEIARTIAAPTPVRNELHSRT